MPGPAVRLPHRAAVGPPVRLRVALWRAFTTARWCDFLADFLTAFSSAFCRARAWAFAFAFFFDAALAVALAVASAASFAVERCLTTT